MTPHEIQHEITHAEVTHHDIQITLANGVKILLSSNPNSTINIHFSEIGTAPIGIGSQAANQLNITYQPRTK